MSHIQTGFIPSLIDVYIVHGKCTVYTPRVIHCAQNKGTGSPLGRFVAGPNWSDCGVFGGGSVGVTVDYVGMGKSVCTNSHSATAAACRLGKVG